MAPVLITRKLKTAPPSLKEPIPVGLCSNVIYKYTCSGCHSSYVGLTTRHLITRINEHRTRDGPIKEHGQECDTNDDEFVPKENFEILNRTNRGMLVLSILEALHIREIKPILNTRDEYRGRTLRVRF